jgi:hypothetical protein
MTRGGYRPGAGRKPAGDRRDATLAGVRVPRGKLDAYHEAARRSGVTLTDWVELHLDAVAGR